MTSTKKMTLVENLRRLPPEKVKVLFLAVAVVISNLSISCSPSPPIDKEQAIALVKREARKRGFKEIEISSVYFRTNYWEVWFSGLPKGPGMNASFDVTTNGQVTNFQSWE